MLASATSGLLLPLVVLLSYYHVEFCSCDNNDKPLYYLKSLGGSKPNQRSREIESLVQIIESGELGFTPKELRYGLKNKYEHISGRELRNSAFYGTYRAGYMNHRLSYLLEPLRIMQQLSEDARGKSARSCGESDARFLVDIMEQEFGGLRNLLGLEQTNSLTLNYLRQFAPELYLHCLIKFDQNLQEMFSHSKPDTEAIMDALVGSRGRTCPANQEVDACLADKAEKLDFARGVFDANKMLTAVGQYLPKAVRHGWLVRGSTKLLNEFVQDVCKDLRKWLAMCFDPYNMAQFLVPKKATELNLSNRSRKLNEYSRICIPVLNANQQVLTNVKLNMVKFGIINVIGLK